MDSQNHFADETPCGFVVLLLTLSKSGGCLQEHPKQYGLLCQKKKKILTQSTQEISHRGICSSKLMPWTAFGNEYETIVIQE